MDPKSLIMLPKTWEAQNEIYRKYCSLRTSECIGLSEPSYKSEILWEKSRRADLIERQATYSRIKTLSMELNRQEIKNRKKKEERKNLHKLVLQAREIKTTELDPIFLELIQIIGSLNARVAENQFRGFGTAASIMRMAARRYLKIEAVKLAHDQDETIDVKLYKPRELLTLKARLASGLKPNMAQKLAHVTGKFVRAPTTLKGILAISYRCFIKIDPRGSLHRIYKDES